MNTIKILTRNQQAMDMGFYKGETYLIKNIGNDLFAVNEGSQSIRLVNIISTGVEFSAHFNEA